ncbi:MAG: lysophospholipid acyltransferase family protein [Saezia sp.]
MYLGSRLTLAFLWLIHWLPLSILSCIGVLLGRLLYRLAHSRRRIALRNIQLCFPEKPPEEQSQIVQEHFELLVRSVLERGLIFYASPKRLKKLIHIEGNPNYAEQHPDKNFTWLIPHFVGLDIAATALSLFQSRLGVSIYQEQSNPIINKAAYNARMRFNRGFLFSRQQGLVPVIKAIRRENAVLATLPDQDFGLQDADFVPFFGIPAATLTSTSRIAHSMKMQILPVIAEILPKGQGYCVRFIPPLEGLPTADAYSDTVKINQFLEQQISQNPAQYLWVHRRFKTRPPGEDPVYE